MSKFIGQNERITISTPGEQYVDLINALSVINGGNPPSSTARSLLMAKIKESIPMIEKRVQYLADKRGITYGEMWQQIITGGYTPLETDAGWEKNNGI
jgi:hypothetical protein